MENLEKKYVIAWDENTFTMRYIHPFEKKGTTIIDQAEIFSTENEAQEKIDENGWINCYVVEIPNEEKEIDAAEFELLLMKKRAEHYENALKTIRDAFYTDGETDKEKVEDLKSIAFNALYEIENDFF